MTNFNIYKQSDDKYWCNGHVFSSITSLFKYLRPVLKETKVWPYLNKSIDPLKVSKIDRGIFFKTNQIDKTL